MRLRVLFASLVVAGACLGPSTALASGVWSAPTKIDNGGDLTSVSCSSATFCAAVADNGPNIHDALTYNGTSWSAPTNVGGSRVVLDSVSCPSATFCAAIGDNGPGVSYALTYNGTSWSAPTHTNYGNGDLNSVSCSSPTFCVAVGTAYSEYVDTWYALTYNGTSWSAPTVINGKGNGYLASVSCSSPTFCAAVAVAEPANGLGVSYALTYNGTSWSAPTQIDGLNLQSVSCSSATFCAAVDQSGAALTYNGTSWSAPTHIGGGFTSVSCPSATFCVAVGYGDIVLTYTTATAGEASASVKVEKFKVTTSSLVVTIKTSRAGTVTITGPGLKKTTRTFAAGTRVMTVALTKAGKAERAGRKKIKLSVSLKMSIKTVSRSVEIKL